MKAIKPNESKTTKSTAIIICLPNNTYIVSTPFILSLHVCHKCSRGIIAYARCFVGVGTSIAMSFPGSECTCHPSPCTYVQARFVWRGANRDRIHVLVILHVVLNAKRAWRGGWWGSAGGWRLERGFIKLSRFLNRRRVWVVCFELMLFVNLNVSESVVLFSFLDDGFSYLIKISIINIYEKYSQKNDILWIKPKIEILR